MTRYLLRIEYFGVNFHGFQKQPGVATVQGALEGALAELTGASVPVAGAGRTDAGAHSLGQAAAIDLSGEVDAGIFIRGINALLPDGAAVREMRVVPDDFDPRRDAVSREYRYFILNRPAPSPILEAFSHHFPRSLDRSAMAGACRLFTGEHDFSAFRVEGGEGASSVRIVFHCQMSMQSADVICITVRANAFLYRMVRIIAGALLAVGSGRMETSELARHLEGGDRPCADPLPAKGLFLWDVTYDL